MKQKFSTKWKASKQPRKQRKYLANAPLHIKRKFLGANLSKDLRKKHGQRSIIIKKGDVVKVMRGKFSKKQGKITDIKTKFGKVYIEGLQIKKRDGSKANIMFRASNLQVIELNLGDSKRRIKIRKSLIKAKEKETTKKPDLKKNLEGKNKK